MILHRLHCKLITFGFLPALVLALVSTSAFAADPTSVALNAEPPASAPPAGAVAASVQPTVPVPDDPLERGTPRSSVEAFLSAAREGNFSLAAQYLDLSRLPADAQASQGPRLSRQLWFVLERRATMDLSALSINPVGESNDGLPPNQDRLVRIEWRGGFADINLERVRDSDGLEVWKVSARSVEQIPSSQSIGASWASRVNIGSTSKVTAVRMPSAPSPRRATSSTSGLSLRRRPAAARPRR